MLNSQERVAESPTRSGRARRTGHDRLHTWRELVIAAGSLAADSDERACEWQWAFTRAKTTNGFESQDLSAVSS